MADNFSRADAYCGRARTYYGMREFDKAIADFSAALKLDSRNGGALIGLGNTYFCKDQYKKSVDYYTQALGIYPKYAYLFVWRCQAFQALRDLPRALADAEEAVRLTPDDPFARLIRGKALQASCEYERAIDDYAAALDGAIRHQSADAFQVDEADRASAPDGAGMKVGALTGLGDCHQCLRKYDRAVEYYSQALALAPKNAYALRWRAWAYHRMGDQERGLADAEALIGLTPEDPDAYMTRGSFRCAANEVERGLADISEAIRLAPRKAEFYSVRAHIYGKNGQPDKALADHGMAIRLAEAAERG
jgi:tetratricopeptide (TPR) repeat protein